MATNAEHDVYNENILPLSQKVTFQHLCPLLLMKGDSEINYKSPQPASCHVLGTCKD